SFYTGLPDRALHIDPHDPDVPTTYAPLTLAGPCAGRNVPCPQSAEARVQAQREASTDAFHLAMFISALLLGVGAAVNAVAIENRPAPQAAEAAQRAVA